MAATHVSVKTEDTKTHRSLSTIEAILAASKLDAPKSRSVQLPSFSSWDKPNPRSTTSPLKRFISMK